MVNLIIQWQIKLAPSIFYIQPSQYAAYIGVIGRRDDSLSTFAVYYDMTPYLPNRVLRP
jgi:hypothetical protein